MPREISGTSEHDIDSFIRNLSVQTGEEFSPQFIRERTPTRKVNTGEESSQMVHKIPLNLFDTLEDCPLEYPQDDVGCWINNEDLKNNNVSSGILSSREHSIEEVKHAYQPYGYVDGSFCGKMKFLCSFGGKILPRPSDGKLRYVGGDTRIVSIKKNINYQEFMTKTFSICNQPHTIKYQLPDEDLDALISVCSDDDLQHMIEEYQELEKGSQRLRIFVINTNDPESPCSNDSMNGYEYVVALNGIKDTCIQKNFSNGNIVRSGVESTSNSQSNTHNFIQPIDKMTSYMQAPATH